MYYGNSSATDGQAATSVWDSNYKGVWHLPNGTTLTANDSTSNSNTGTITGATAATGQIDGAGSFDGTDDYIITTVISKPSSFTINGWVKTTSTFLGNIFSWGGSANLHTAEFRLTTGGNLEYGEYDGSFVNATSNGTVNNGQWHFVSVVKSGSSITFYIDGASSGTGTVGQSPTLNTNIVGARYQNGSANNHFFNGQIDETRISNTARSAAYIAASYKSEADTFNTFASEESVYSSTPGTLTSSIFDTEFSGGAAWGTLTYTATTPSNTSVSVKARTSNSSSMTGATAFSSCTAITSGSDISSNSCVTDSHRYIQYQLSLANTDSVSTPTFQDVSIAFATYDSTAPTISLTALATDPNSDTTPTLSGTATEGIGTVSNVQFQMDSTSGSWTACTASDGTFDEATEAFSCTPSALSDGSHTMYVRATDSNSNTTSNASASTDTFTIDVTAPASFDLDSPGNDSYTSNERPTFKWKATTDATSGLSSYTLEVDNGASGDFSITGIPTSRTTDYDTSTYLAHYDNFSDSDSTNNYISIYTKSSSSWGNSENDGKLKEGSVGWKIKAIDVAGNERSEGRTLIVDFTSPTLSSLSSSDSAGSKDSYLLVTNQKPNITGTITDNYSPDKVEVSVYKESYFLGVETSKELVTALTYLLSNGSNQTSLSFSIPIPDSLDFGSYQVGIKGVDKAGNKSSLSTIYLKILTSRQAKELLQGKLSEEKKTIQEKSQVSLPRLEEKAKERRQREAEELEKTISPIAEQFKNQVTNLKMAVDGTKVFLAGLASGVAVRIQDTSEALLLAVSRVTPGIVSTTSLVLVKPWQDLSAVLDNSSVNIQREIARAYRSKPPVEGADQILRPLADLGLAVRETVGQITTQTALNTWAGVKEINNALTQASDNLQRQIAKNNLEKFKFVRRGVSNLAFGVGEKAQNISDRAGFEIVQFGYLFVNEPTKISDVEVITLSPTSVKVSWKTNHPANGKVNYGLDRTYPFDVQTSKRTTHHEFTLNDLQPDTLYYFEVMSQNKNYVYDANREFKTPGK